MYLYEVYTYDPEAYYPTLLYHEKKFSEEEFENLVVKIAVQVVEEVYEKLRTHVDYEVKTVLDRIADFYLYFGDIYGRPVVEVVVDKLVKEHGFALVEKQGKVGIEEYHPYHSLAGQKIMKALPSKCIDDFMVASKFAEDNGDGLYNKRTPERKKYHQDIRERFKKRWNEIRNGA